MILDLLDVATIPADVELPSLRLEHQGELPGGGIKFGIIRANQWQVTFTWRDGNAYDVDVVDFKLAL